jgi:hypothetical protein
MSFLVTHVLPLALRNIVQMGSPLGELMGCLFQLYSVVHRRRFDGDAQRTDKVK